MSCNMQDSVGGRKCLFFSFADPSFSPKRQPGLSWHSDHIFPIHGNVPTMPRTAPIQHILDFFHLVIWKALKIKTHWTFTLSPEFSMGYSKTWMVIKSSLCHFSWQATKFLARINKQVCGDISSGVYTMTRRCYFVRYATWQRNTGASILNSDQWPKKLPRTGRKFSLFLFSPCTCINRRYRCSKFEKKSKLNLLLVNTAIKQGRQMRGRIFSGAS